MTWLTDFLSLWWAETLAAVGGGRKPAQPSCCNHAPNPVDIRRPSKADLDVVRGATPRPKFVFSKRSLDNLSLVKAGLKKVAQKALVFTAVDFVVIEGLRTRARQKKLVRQGASQTMNSKHLTGDAIDLVAFVDGDISWDAVYFLQIATAFVYAAKEANVGVRWGGAWHIADIRDCADKDDPGKTMMELYKQLRKSQGRRVFLDVGHFELAKE